MNLLEDNYREIFKYISDRQVLICSVICKSWLQLLKDRRARIATYGLGPKIFESATIKRGIYQGNPTELFQYFNYYFDYVTLLPANNFEIRIEPEIKDEKVRAEKFDTLHKKLERLGIECKLTTDILCSIITINYRIDLGTLYAEIDTLGLRIYRHDKGPIALTLSEYVKVQNTMHYHQYKYQHPSDVFLINLECSTTNYQVYYRKLIDLIERIKLPKSN